MFIGSSMWYGHPSIPFILNQGVIKLHAVITSLVMQDLTLENNTVGKVNLVSVI